MRSSSSSMDIFESQRAAHRGSRSDSGSATLGKPHGARGHRAGQRSSEGILPSAPVQLEILRATCPRLSSQDEPRKRQPPRTLFLILNKPRIVKSQRAGRTEDVWVRGRLGGLWPRRSQCPANRPVTVSPRHRSPGFNPYSFPMVLCLFF